MSAPLQGDLFSTCLHSTDSGFSQQFVKFAMTKIDFFRVTTERHLYKIIADAAIEYLTPEGRVAFIEFLEDAREASIEVLIDTIQSDFGTDAERNRFMTISDTVIESFRERLSN